ncbi:MAG: membrane-bound lytic murein transglycosylase MltF [Gammaproteobacteria bacterium]|nr:membrane-bound lytic murein transglycosylase MltF [Gammaproteobacteria bacterium]
MLRLFHLQSFSAFCIFCLLVSGCSEKPTSLEEIKKRGEIRFAVRTGPASYYVDKDGENGLEFELATQFAGYLGVNLSLIIANNDAETKQLVKSDEADVAVGSIAQVKQPDSLLLYGPGYQWVTRQIIYRTSYWRPSSLADIHPDELHTVAGTVPPLVLNKLKKEVPSLAWNIHDDKENLDLLALVENGEILYAVAYSNDVILARESYPEIRPAFNLTEPEPLSWAIRYSEDRSLLNEIEKFHQNIADSGQLADLIERFYGPSGFFDYVDSRKFVDKYRKSLPALKAYFKRSAYEYSIDWRLLAALSYQESHWNKNARSHTGVRGLMMLTRTTAKQVGVKDRLDPKQSIEGGAKYLKSLIDRVPKRITEPDRTWLALAAYNVGFGHLEDARILTERDGGNPDLWEDVKQRLPLLSKSKWYKQTKHGYARGNEPVKFVRKIRKYYNVLVNLTQENTRPRAQLADSVSINSPVL